MIKIRSSESFGFENSQEKKSVLVKGVTAWTKTQIQLMSDVLLRLVERYLVYVDCSSAQTAHKPVQQIR